MPATTPNRRPVIAAIITAVLAISAVPAAFANNTVALKNALYGAGYDVDNVSKTMDSDTRSALRAFQQDQGLKATGELNEATKSALGMVPMEVAVNQASGDNNSSAKGGETASVKAGAEPEKDDAVEEDEDGGWSLF
ncbi:peptidoglycan-binding domain 1 protein-like protein [Marinobacter lipolyticus SM19]|uniref:Peptidoglycan-binding domain 1 protein-like protein n=1 Tax=Marinobacter lipolyticus SM19 TaxID=1318628 RepID=R8AYA9_9GAMM|nr:peptidoglycan-binding domain-containing protein [Marinobacter lipolyticus]EON91318.1 peptidoglycan-binding domain 1 protein-like protein [Marinobacter lipolyticus SM19]